MGFYNVFAHEISFLSCNFKQISCIICLSFKKKKKKPKPKKHITKKKNPKGGSRESLGEQGREKQICAKLVFSTDLSTQWCKNCEKSGISSSLLQLHLLITAVFLVYWKKDPHSANVFRGFVLPVPRTG